MAQELLFCPPVRVLLQLFIAFLLTTATAVASHPSTDPAPAGAAADDKLEADKGLEHAIEGYLYFEARLRTAGSETDVDFYAHAYSDVTFAGETPLRMRFNGRLIADNLSLPVYPAISMKFPLVDTNEANGSTELIPCTHHCAVAGFSHLIGSVEAAADFNAMIEAGRFPSKMRLNLKRGTAYLFDPRLIHCRQIGDLIEQGHQMPITDQARHTSTL